MQIECSSNLAWHINLRANSNSDSHSRPRLTSTESRDANASSLQEIYPPLIAGNLLHATATDDVSRNSGPRGVAVMKFNYVVYQLICISAKEVLFFGKEITSPKTHKTHKRVKHWMSFYLLSWFRKR